jgi:hypothetical protein
VNTSPAAPWLEFDLKFATAGTFGLDLLGAGPGQSSDSLWVQVPTATLVATEGNAVAAGNSLLVGVSLGQFTWRNAGQWSFSAESGAALDALRLEPIAQAASLAALADIETLSAAPARRAKRK